MKTVIGYVIAALLLGAAGGVCWALGGAERRLAEAHQALATMQYATVADRSGELERSLRLVTPVPRIGGRMTAAVHEDQSTAEYWLAQYDTLVTHRDAAGAVVEHDPEVLLVAANAAYRSVNLNATNRQALGRSLDGIIKSYAEILKSDAAPEDAAYNYEFLVRQRDAIARARGAGAARTGAAAAAASIHGHLGAPPKDVEMSNFRIIVPKQSDERDEELKPGTGDVKNRKG